MNSDKNPWKKISQKSVYDNNWIEVQHHEVINPSGNQGIYGKIHFKNIAIGIIPVDEENNTWLIGQYRYPLDLYSWEIPEGGGALDIKPIESAKRELLEETGIRAKKWQLIQHIHTSNSVSDESGIIYLAQDLSFSQAQPEETEQLMVKKIKLKEVYKLILRGEITDSLSLAGILRLKCEFPHFFEP